MNKVLEVLSTHKELVTKPSNGLVVKEIEFISVDEGMRIHFWRDYAPFLILSLGKEDFLNLLNGRRVNGYALNMKVVSFDSVTEDDVLEFIYSKPHTKFDDKFEHRFWNLYQMNLMKDYSEKDAFEKAWYQIEKFNQGFNDAKEFADKVKCEEARRKKEERYKGAILPFELDDETPF